MFEIYLMLSFRICNLKLALWTTFSSLPEAAIRKA